MSESKSPEQPAQGLGQIELSQYFGHGERSRWEADIVRISKRAHFSDLAFSGPDGLRRGPFYDSVVGESGVLEPVNAAESESRQSSSQNSWDRRLFLDFSVSAAELKAMLAEVPTALVDTLVLHNSVFLQPDFVEVIQQWSDTAKVYVTEANVTAGQTIPESWQIAQMPMQTLLASATEASPVHAAETLASCVAKVDNAATWFSALEIHNAGAETTVELAVLLLQIWQFDLALRSQQKTLNSDQRFEVHLAQDRDFYVTVAKTRACLSLVKALTTQLGWTAKVDIVSHSSWRSLTAVDPWSNMLRLTTQALGAVVGGAPAVALSSFDRALGSPTALGLRQSVNLHSLLQEECHFDAVVDPTAGAFAYESLSLEIAQQAYELFQSWIDADDPLTELINSGTLNQLVATQSIARQKRFATRRDGIIGVSEFAQFQDSVEHQSALVNRQASDLPFGVTAGSARFAASRRDAEAWEQLRIKSYQFEAANKRFPLATIFTVSDPVAMKPRLGFTERTCHAGGFSTQNLAASAIENEQLSSAARETLENSELIVICGLGDDYTSSAKAHLENLKKLSSAPILIAGASSAQLDELKDSGLFANVGLKVDCVAIFQSIYAEIQHVKN